MRRVVWIALVIGALAVLGWVQRDALPAVANQLLAADWRLALAALAPLAGVELVKAYRWQALYGADRPTYLHTLQGLLLAQLANTAMPLRLGEGLRVLWAAPSVEGVARGAASLGITKLVDALILALLVAIVLGAWALGGAEMIAVGLGVGALVVAAVVASGWRWAQHSRNIVARTARWSARYLRELNASVLWTTLWTSALAWLGGALANIFVLAALGLTPTVDLAARMLASGYLAGLVPAPPGRVGVYEAAVVSALSSGGVPVETALAVALLLHGLQLIKVGGLALLATRW